MALLFLGVIFLTSCSVKYYLQKFEDYNQFSKTENQQLIGGFPAGLIKSDASSIKNIFYLKTKYVFGIFNYENDEMYDDLFKVENQI